MTTAAPDNPPPKHTPSRAAVLCGLILFAAWTIGQVWRDRTWFTGLLFYYPTPVMTVTMLGLGLWGLRRRWRAGAIVMFVLSAVGWVWVAAVENSLLQSAAVGPPAAHNLRLVHWNVNRGMRGWPAIREQLQAMSADAYVVSEVPWSFSAADFPGYDVVRLDSIVVAVRGKLTKVETLRDSSLGQINALIWESARGDVHLMVADFPSSIRVHRHPQLIDLVGLIGQHHPDLVVGDFNAPRRSAALCNLPPGYQHAYDSVGSGWSYTWPTPVPVYAIDQCLHGPRIRPLRHELTTSFLSDHRLQRFEFELDGEM